MNKLTRLTSLTALLFATLFGSQSLLAQEPVVGVDDPESLFVDDDPVKHRNKQSALHIMRELLQCNHWDDARNWLADPYLQHNPMAGSGVDAVMSFFSSRPRTPTCDELTTPIVAVLAEGDLVTVVIAREYPHPTREGETYSTTWFDMWRFEDGKAVEHWDPATL